jgi:hypothetical protein
MAAAKENQSNNITKSISAKDIVIGKVSLDNLSEPYLIPKDSYANNLAKAVNILAIKDTG